MQYKVVFFDLGGVVVDVESDRLMHQVSQLVGRPFEEVQAAVYHKELMIPFELGQVTAKGYYDGLKKSLALSWTYEQFVRMWNGIFVEKTEVTQIMGRLRNRHTLIALSNTNELHIDHIRRTVSSLAVFHDWVASCDVGLRKPDPKIYELALNKADARAYEAVYVDDRPELVEAGKMCGMRAIRFQNPRQLEQDLQAVGLNL